jgi:hypothetical protein
MTAKQSKMHKKTGFEGAGKGSGDVIGRNGTNRGSVSSLGNNTGVTAGSMPDAHAAEGIMHEAPAVAAGMNHVDGVGAGGQTQAAQMVLEHARVHVHARQLQLQQHNKLQIEQQQQQVQQEQQRHQLHHTMSYLSSQLGRNSPQHDRYILNSLKHLQIIQQQQNIPLPVVGAGVGLPHQGHGGMLHQQSHPSASGGLGGGAMVLTTHTSTHPTLNLNVNVTTFSAMNAAVREAQIQQRREEEDLHKKRLSLLIEKVCAKNAPHYPPPPVEVFAGGCRVEESNVTSYDVLAGRGNRVNNHEGNIRFRELVKPFKVQYLQKTTRKLTKAQMCAVLVNYVRTCTPTIHGVTQGRFLKKDPHTKLWVEIGDEKARKKAGQALREDATVIRAELGIAKPGAGAAIPSSADTNNEYESPPAKKKEDEEEDTETAAIGVCSNPPKEEPSFAADANNDAPAEEEEETEKNGLVGHQHVSSLAGSAAVADATGKIHQEAFERRRVASVPLNLTLNMDIPSPIRNSNGDSMFHLKRRNTIHTPDGVNISRNMAMAARSDSSSSMSMMSSATAVMGNLTSNVQVNFLEEQCQASAVQNGEQELLLKQKLRFLMSQRKHRPSLKVNAMTDTVDKFPSQISLHNAISRAAGLAEQDKSSTPSPSPLVGGLSMSMPEQKPSLTRGSENSEDGSFDLPLTLTAGENVSVRYSSSNIHHMGIVSNVNSTAASSAAGRTHIILAGSSRSSSGISNNASVPRLDVSNRTIQESLAKHVMEGGSDGGNSLDSNSNYEIGSEQEEQTCSRLYSKTPSKQRLIKKKSDSKSKDAHTDHIHSSARSKEKNLSLMTMTTEQDEEVLVASAAAAFAFGHQRDSSSGSNNSIGGTDIGPSSPKRRPGQVSASLRRSMKGHAHAGTHWSSIRSGGLASRNTTSPNAQRNTSICTKDLIESIVNHNAASRRGGGDQTRDQKSMFDSSMTVSSHFGNSNSALSSTNWNSHGSMSMVDFFFGNSDVEDDADAEEEDHGGLKETEEEDDRKPQADRRSAAATAADTGATGAGGGSDSLNHNSSAGSNMSYCSLAVASLTHSLNMSIYMSGVNSTASHSSSSHSASHSSNKSGGNMSIISNS